MQKKVHKPQLHEESMEAHTSVNASMSDISSAGLDSIWKDLLGGGVKDIVGQVSGTYSHDLKPGEEHSLKAEKHDDGPQLTEQHMEYFREIKNADIAPAKQMEANLARQINDIRLEIQQLISESTQLETTFKSVQINQKIVKAGKYHETLFDFIRSLIRSARVSLKEGASWLNTTKSKKQQRQYQSMAKKHGTSFTLNNERTAATQTG